MDRKEALFFYLLTLAGIWATLLATLVPNQQVFTPYGIRVLEIDSISVLVGTGIGVLIYKAWPKKSFSAKNQVVIEKGQAPEPRTRRDEFRGRTDKSQYERGQNVFFVVSFKGRLLAGFYESVILDPGERLFAYSWDPQTLPFARPETPGTLCGAINSQNWRWGWPIPMDAPLGEYTAHIGVYDTYPLDKGTGARARVLRNWLIRKIIRKSPGTIAAPARPPVAQVTVKFTVVRRTSQGSLP